MPPPPTQKVVGRQYLSGLGSALTSLQNEWLYKYKVVFGKGQKEENSLEKLLLMYTTIFPFPLIQP